MTQNNLPPEPPPVFLPEPERTPDPRLRPATSQPEPGRLKFDFPADKPPEQTEPAPRKNSLPRSVLILILGIMLVVSVQSESPVPMLIGLAALFVFRKRLRRDR